MRTDPADAGHLLEGGSGLRARVSARGATLLELRVPDGAGGGVNVVDVSPGRLYAGATVGRCANRIAGACFELDGRVHRLTANEGRHHLHGGRSGLDRPRWSATRLAAGRVRFTHTSPDGHEGYPGRLEMAVTFALTGAHELRLDYEARTDAPTPVNLTHHSYFNLGGAGSVLDHELWIAARLYTPTDAERIPTGAVEPVAGTPLDFTEPRRIARAAFDHNFVLDAGGGDLALAARLTDPSSGRRMELWTTEPGLQLYVTEGSLCLETQRFPDAVHHPDFPSVILRPGETYRQCTVHRFTG